LAIVRLNIQIIKSLINKGADLKKVDNEGNTPLHLVMNIFSKNPEICSKVLEMVVENLNGVMLNRKNKDNFTALHVAVKRC